MTAFPDFPESYPPGPLLFMSFFPFACVEKGFWSGRCVFSHPSPLAIQCFRGSRPFGQLPRNLFAAPLLPFARVHEPPEATRKSIATVDPSSSLRCASARSSPFSPITCRSILTRKRSRTMTLDYAGSSHLVQVSSPPCNRPD